MRELLLAYLFGQLDPHEREQIERALVERPQLRKELCRLRDCLDAEEAADAVEAVDPPPYLVERTCSQVASRVDWDSDELHGDRWSSGAWQPNRFSTATSEPGLGSSSRCSLGDLAVTAGITCVVAMLIFPAIQNSRAVARIEQCRNNLRLLGEAVLNYAGLHNDFIPHVPAEGRESFGGYFVIQLQEANVVDPQELGPLLICPAAIEVQDWQSNRFVVRMHIPTASEFAAIPERLLPVVQQELAGDYGYRPGYRNEVGWYTAWRIDHSESSALLADAPSLDRADVQSANHGGRGQNVYFADGHIELLYPYARLRCGDHLFQNREGQRAAGCDKRDNVIVRSEDRPLPAPVQAVRQQP